MSWVNTVCHIKKRCSVLLKGSFFFIISHLFFYFYFKQTGACVKYCFWSSYGYFVSFNIFFSPFVYSYILILIALPVDLVCFPFCMLLKLSLSFSFAIHLIHSLYLSGSQSISPVCVCVIYFWNKPKKNNLMFMLSVDI